MALTIYMSVVSLVLAFGSLFLVIDQRKTESVVRILDVNRQLLILGFSTRELFEVLKDSPEADPDLQRRYLQLWFNQFLLIHFAMSRGLFSAELREWLEREVEDFMRLNSSRQHWRKYERWFPASFQIFINNLCNEPPDSQGEA